MLFLNLPETITFTNGDEVQYLYDATGRVLQKTFLQGGVVSEQTDYLGGIEVNQDGKWTIYNEEGITLLQNGEGPGMRVFLRDHQGSTRVVLNPHPEDLEFMATMESELSADEEEWFGNLDTRVTMAAANHTPGGNEAARLNSNTPAGPSLVLAVYPGDVVELETYAYYENFTANGTLGSTALIAGIAGAFGGVNGGTEGQQLIFDAVDAALGLFGLLGDNNSTEPQAYLNYILFDEAMQPADFGFAGVTAAANLNQELLQLQVNVSKSGYLFIYTSNESNSTDPVYFDDLRATLHPGKVDAAYDYYPFGMATADSWERVTSPVVDRKYQGAFSTFEKETNYYAFESRFLDPEIGRWIGVDPEGQFASPYVGMGNNPLVNIDPDGEWVATVGGIILGAYIGGVSSSGEFNPAKWDGKDWAWAAVGAVAGGVIGYGLEYQGPVRGNPNLRSTLGDNAVRAPNSRLRYPSYKGELSKEFNLFKHEQFRNKGIDIFEINLSQVFNLGSAFRNFNFNFSLQAIEFNVDLFGPGGNQLFNYNNMFGFSSDGQSILPNDNQQTDQFNENGVYKVNTQATLNPSYLQGGGEEIFRPNEYGSLRITANTNRLTHIQYTTLKSSGWKGKVRRLKWWQFWK